MADCSSLGAELVEARLDGLEERNIWDPLQVHVRHHVQHRTRDVLGLHALPRLQEGLADLSHCDEVLMRQVLELPGDLEHDVVPLRENVTQLPDGLAHGVCLLPLHDAVLCTVSIVSIVVVVQGRLCFHHAHREVLVEHLVAELVVADLAVLSDVEVPHEDQHLLGGRLEAPLVQGLLELLLGDDSILVGIESPEDVPDQRVLLPHALPDLLEHGRQVVRANVATLLDVFPRVLVHVDDLELPVVHLDDAAGAQVCILEDLARDLVHVNALFQVPARDDAHVPLRWLVDRHCIVEEVEIDDE
mmetsp:Transcript_85927/g.218972  ORF Transcript_85927/g.218972 Transcript_85927/m.218972 type:complete len:302 (+) Transcript_85927:82-987(+)